MKLGQWLGFLCLIIALIILWQIRQMLLLVFTAVVISTALNSLVRRLTGFGIRRGWSVLITFGLLCLFGALFFGLVVPPFAGQFQRLIELLPAGLNRALVWLNQFVQEGPDWLSELQVPDPGSLTREIRPVVQNLLENFFAFFSNSLTALLQVLLVIVLSIMLLVNPLAYRQAFLQLFPSFYRRRADEILADCEIALGNWLGGILINSLFVATLSGVGLWVLQIQLVLAHALLAGLLNFIPNIGPALSVVFPLTIALLEPDNQWKALAVIILYVIIQNIESYWLTPTVMARQVSLLPAVTLSAQLFFAGFFGLLGLLLALPLTVVAKTWIQEALVKDILDQWGNDASPVAVGHAPSDWMPPPITELPPGEESSPVSPLASPTTPEPPAAEPGSG